jgi:hypothetical protein
MLRTLRESLADHDLPMLRAIARARGLELQEMRQAQAVNELKTHLLNQEATDWALSRLDQGSRAALDTLSQAGGKMKAHLFTHSFGTLRPIGPGRLEREKPWLAPASAAEQLWFMGLIFKTFAEVGQGYRTEFFYIPSDLVPLLPPVQVKLPQFVVESLNPPSFVRQGGPSLLEDLFSLLTNLQVAPLPTNPQGQLTPTARQQIHRYFQSPAALLDQGLPPEQLGRIEFLYHLVRVAGQVHVVDRRLKPNPVRVKPWLKLGQDRQLFTLQQTWQKDATWDELRHIPSLKIEETGWQNDPVLARQAILAHLSLCPAGTWLSITSLVEAIKAVDPDFARPDGDYRSWYIRDAATGEYLMDFACWDQVEGALVRHVITGPLFALGVTDLGYEEGADLPTAFRITAGGAAFLGLGPPPADREAPPLPLTVQPDFTVHLPAGSRLHERFQVHRFARFRQVVEDSEIVYQISRRSLYAAQQQGISPRMIVAFLQKNSRGSLPASVVAALRKWRA